MRVMGALGITVREVARKPPVLTGVPRDLRRLMVQVRDDEMTRNVGESQPLLRFCSFTCLSFSGVGEPMSPLCAWQAARLASESGGGVRPQVPTATILLRP
eukprot:COSAG01_NODE_724_length_14056_cov_41.795443_10_plen_101_part_00